MVVEFAAVDADEPAVVEDVEAELLEHRLRCGIIDEHRADDVVTFLGDLPAEGGRHQTAVSLAFVIVQRLQDDERSQLVFQDPGDEFIVALEEESSAAVHLDEGGEISLGAGESVRPDGIDERSVVRLQRSDVHLGRAIYLEFECFLPWQPPQIRLRVVRDRELQLLDHPVYDRAMLAMDEVELDHIVPVDLLRFFERLIQFLTFVVQCEHEQIIAVRLQNDDESPIRFPIPEGCKERHVLLLRLTLDPFHARIEKAEHVSRERHMILVQISQLRQILQGDRLQDVLVESHLRY